MADETTTTETSATENSEVQTQTSETQEQGSPTSTTETEDSINLGEPAKEEETQAETETEAKAEDEPNPLFGAPAEGENYEISGLPDGMELDTAALEAAAPVFRELGLSNEGASRVAQVYAEQILPTVQKGFETQMEQRITAQRTEWEGEARDLIAGKAETPVNAAGEALKFESTNLKQVQSVAARALDQLAPQGFRAWLDETGLGVHPQMIAFAYQAGLRLTEEREIEPSEGAPSRQKSRTEKYYG